MTRPLIRPATAQDLECILEFQQAMAMESEGRRLEDARLRAGVAGALADAQRGRYLIAERAGSSQGCLMLTREWSDWRNGWFWWVQSVYTVPAARRTGVYRALYEQVLREAREDPQVCGVRLYVEKDNRVAQSTYGALGMQQAVYDLWEVDFSHAPRESPAGAE